MNEKYYILNLWDYGTPAFVSFDKMYVGTEAEIRAAIDAMKKSQKEAKKRSRQPRDTSQATKPPHTILLITKSRCLSLAPALLLRPSPLGLTPGNIRMCGAFRI